MLLCLRMAMWQEGEERDYNMKTGTCPAYCAGCVPVIVCGMWLCLRAFTACVGIAVHAGGYTSIKIQAVHAGGCTSIKSKPQTAGKWGGMSPLLGCLRLVVCSLWSVVCIYGVGFCLLPLWCLYGPQGEFSVCGGFPCPAPVGQGCQSSIEYVMVETTLTFFI